MLKTVIKKGLRENLYSHKFLVFFLLTSFLISITTLFLVQKQKHRITDYDLAIKEISDQRKSIVTYSAKIDGEGMTAHRKINCTFYNRLHYRFYHPLGLRKIGSFLKLSLAVDRF